MKSLFLLPLVLTGCSMFQPAVPTTVIKATVAGQQLKLENPKNTLLTGLTFEVDTNQTAKLTIQSVSSTNDVQVVDKAYAGQALVIKEMYDGANGLINAAVAGAVKGAK